MDKKKVREYAKRGSDRAHALGKAHKFSHEEAVRAGRLGGFSRWRKERQIEDLVE